MSLSNKLSINDVDVKGKRVLIRVSADCPTIGCIVEGVGNDDDVAALQALLQEHCGPEEAASHELVLNMTAILKRREDCQHKLG